MRINTFATTIALLSLPFLAFSQAPVDTTAPSYTEQLREVIVTGNIKTDPTLTIVKEDFSGKAVQPKNSGELFNDINGFSLIKRGNYAVDPSFRANQYEQLNVQFDGGVKAMHACPNRMDPITTLVNPEEVSKIEIIKGPFSVRYGAAFGGVINLVTNHRPAFMHGNTSGSISSGYESNGNSWVNMVQLGQRIGKWDASALLSYRDYGNYKDGNGVEIPSSFRSLGYSFKTGYNFSDAQRLQIGIRQNFGRDVLHAGLPMDTKFDNSSILSADYRWAADRTWFKGLSVKAYYALVDHEMNNYNRPAYVGTEAVAGVNAGTLGGRVETEWDLAPKVKLFAGADYGGLSREGNRDRLVKKNMAGQTLPVPLSFTDKVWQNSRLNQTGAFAEGKYLANRKNVFTYGARVDFVGANATDFDPTFAALYTGLGAQNEVNFSGNIAYRHELAPMHSFEIALGRGVRTANIEERYIAFFNIGRDPYEYIGNPYLKPEVNHQAEIAFKGKKILNTEAFPYLSYQVSAYYADYSNYIMGVVDESLTRKYNPTQEPKHPKVFRNIAHAGKKGFEAMLGVGLPAHFNLKADVSYVYTENKDLNESLPLTPPLMTRLLLGYERSRFWANVRYTITARQDRISTAYAEEATAGYEVLDVEAGTTLFKYLKIGAGVSNLLDKQYTNHLTFAFNNVEGFGRVPVPEPGINFTVFAHYAF